MDFLLVLFFLGLSLTAYVVFAGADFGAGIVELTAPRRMREELRELTYRAIGPVWEANHIWIILAIVILFIAFPSAYALVCTALHIPLTLLLLGIVVRGCAFTFRHYDAFQDQSQRLYSLLFVWSSLLTPFAFGVCAGALLYGEIRSSGGSFATRFVDPWCNWFCASVGLFLVFMCAMLASAYLVKEAASDEHRSYFAQRSRQFSIATVLSGGLVFLIGQSKGLDLITRFIEAPLSLMCMFGASVFLVLLWCVLNSSVDSSSNKEFVPSEWIRLSAAGVVVCILLGWLALQYPVMIFQADQAPLTVYSAVAGDATLRGLRWSLLLGSTLIIPALFFLLITFKRERNEQK